MGNEIPAPDLVLARGACGCVWTLAAIHDGKPCENGCPVPWISGERIAGALRKMTEEREALQAKHDRIDLAFRRLLDAAKHVRATLAFDALTVTQEELHEFMSKAVAEAELARKR